MKLFAFFLMIYAIFGVDLVASLTTEEYYECEKEWRRLICGDFNEDMLRAMLECHNNDPHGIMPIYRGCQTEASPQSSDCVGFMKAACAETALFATFDACMKPHIEDEEFLKKVDESLEDNTCILEVMDKYGVLTEELKSKRK